MLSNERHCCFFYKELGQELDHSGSFGQVISMSHWFLRSSSEHQSVNTGQMWGKCQPICYSLNTKCSRSHGFTHLNSSTGWGLLRSCDIFRRWGIARRSELMWGRPRVYSQVPAHVLSLFPGPLRYEEKRRCNHTLPPMWIRLQPRLPHHDRPYLLKL